MVESLAVTVARLGATVEAMDDRLALVEREGERTRRRLHDVEDYQVGVRSAQIATDAMRAAASALSTKLERRVWMAVGTGVTLLNVGVSNHWFG
jgi:hypothetical protein